MSPLFCAFDRPVYKKLIPQHLADCLLFPQSITDNLKDGGFVISIKGSPWYSIGIDEGHEVMINKDCKIGIVRPSEESMARMTLYFPYRAKLMQCVKVMLNKDDDKVKSSFSRAMKSVDNINAMLQSIRSSNLLPLQNPPNAVLRNEFTKEVATTDQQYSLLNYRKLGQEDLDAHIKNVYLKLSSAKPVSHRLKLETFGSKKEPKTSAKSLIKEKELVTKCLKNRLLWANSNPNNELQLEQYLELPRAIADHNGLPNKGSKSTSTTFFEKRYQGIVCKTFPQQWFPEVYIAEGMFMINSTPLRIHKYLQEYAQFLFQHFFLKYIKAGIKEIHVLFDDEGRLPDHVKSIERSRRDSSQSDNSHEHFEAVNDAELPSKWRQVISCRVCKHG